MKTFSDVSEPWKKRFREDRCSSSEHFDSVLAALDNVSLQAVAALRQVAPLFSHHGGSSSSKAFKYSG